MLLSIENKVLEKYPETRVGYLVAKGIVTKNSLFVEELKAGLTEAVKAKGIDASNFSSHPNVTIWKKIYEKDFNVEVKKYSSSIEALLARVVKGKKLWDISNVVDLYNCCSISHLLPMGGYDLNKVTGDIVIRFGQEEDSFLGLGKKEPVEIRRNHVVYADASKVLCWLWNYKDSCESCIDDHTQEVVFFVDSVQESTHPALDLTLQELICNLKKINWTPINHGILNSTSAQGMLK